MYRLNVMNKSIEIVKSVPKDRLVKPYIFNYYYDLLDEHKDVYLKPSERGTFRVGIDENGYTTYILYTDNGNYIKQYYEITQK